MPPSPTTFAMPVADIEPCRRDRHRRQQPAPRSCRCCTRACARPGRAAPRCTSSIRSISTSPSRSPASHIVAPSQIAATLADAGLRDCAEGRHARGGHRRRHRREQPARRRHPQGGRRLRRRDRRRAVPHPAGRQRGRPVRSTACCRRSRDAQAMLADSRVRPTSSTASSRAWISPTPRPRTRRWVRRRSWRSATSPAARRAPSPT